MITMAPPMVPGIGAAIDTLVVAVLGDGELGKDAVAVLSETVNASGSVNVKYDVKGMEKVTLDGACPYWT